MRQYHPSIVLQITVGVLFMVMLVTVMPRHIDSDDGLVRMKREGGDTYLHVSLF